MKSVYAFFVLSLALALSLPGSAQQSRPLVDCIRTLQVLPNGHWNQLPLLMLGSVDRLDISFDDLTPEYQRYRYRVVQCNYDWQENSSLFESDYLRGETTDQPIDDYQESLATTQHYTHYTLTFPNERMRPALSGNYKLIIFNDDEEEDVAEVCFCVVEEIAAIQPEVTGQTDIDFQKSHQQVKFKVALSNRLRVSDAIRETKVVVLQNNRWDNAVFAPKPDYVTPTDLQWEISAPLIFKAGNEFRKFEMLNLRTGGMGIDNVRFFEPYYHVTLYADKVRTNYIYDEEQNGAYYIRTENNRDADVCADYALVHFTLQSDYQKNGDVYVAGALSYWQYDKAHRMTYNHDAHQYEATLLLKQGYYNYQYLYLPDKASVGQTAPMEGDFYQTENQYAVLVYHRAQGGRYDRLVGYRSFRHFSDR